MLSAISRKGEFRFMLHDGTVTASVFKTFLPRLMVGGLNLVFIVVDGHATHNSRRVHEYVEIQIDKMQLLSLSLYLSQFKPDEQLWAYVKMIVSSRFIKTKDEMQ